MCCGCVERGENYIVREMFIFSSSLSPLPPNTHPHSRVLHDRFLVDAGREFDCRRWASEGLAYLTLDADVKEYIVSDEKILEALLSVCLSEGGCLNPSCLRHVMC